MQIFEGSFPTKIWDKINLLFVICLISGCALNSPPPTKTLPPKDSPPPPTQTPFNRATDPLTSTTPPQIFRTEALDSWVMGVDVSYVTRVEEKGGVYRYPDGKSGDIFDILSSFDVEMVRLRVWNDPAEGYGGKKDVLGLAKRADDAGLNILLDFHYSDFWADPAKQNQPAAWADLSFEDLIVAVYDYSAEIVDGLIAQGTPPTIVQIGNEITYGFLWPAGRVNDAQHPSNGKQWRQFSELVTAGINGVKSTGSNAKIMLHIDRGGQNNNEIGRWFFDNITAEGVSFDLIGISYYPFWHGPFEILEFNIRDLIERYQKSVIVVETSYMWTLDWDDQTNNNFGLHEQTYPGFPPSPQGQHDFLQKLAEISKNAGAAGLFYWGGEWIAGSAEDQNGSPWENQALFDFEGAALPALTVFGEK